MNMHRVAAAAALLAVLAAVPSSGGPVRKMQLRHADAGRGLAPGELLERMALRSKTRAARLLSGSSSSSAIAPVTPGNGPPQQDEYLISFAIGTPPQPVTMTLDTGSDLIWTQCLPCPACYDQAPLPYFNTSHSSTFQVLPCNSSTCQQLPWPSCGTAGTWGDQTCVYTYSYGDRSVTNGLLAADTFTFSGEAAGGGAAAGVAFGCGLFNQGLLDFNTSGTGIAGFSRGNLSLPSQLKVDNFSYCFTNLTASAPSPVLLGLPANLYRGGGAAVQTTPLIQSSVQPTFYYLPLKSITVGSATLRAPESAFALKDDGTGGTIIDSGTSITSLPPPVYSLLRDALVSELKMTPVMTNSSLGSDLLCFPASATTTVPKLQLHFEDAVLDLPRENYVFEVEDAGGQSVMCVAISSSGGDMTIIGNFQQQNMHVLYDLAGNTLSFVPAQCDMI